jgi:hypothetical protein
MRKLIDNKAGAKAIFTAFVDEQFVLCGEESLKVPESVIESLKYAQERMNELVSLSQEEIEKRTEAFNKSLSAAQGGDDSDAYIDKLMGLIPPDTIADDEVSDEVSNFFDNLRYRLAGLKSPRQYIMEQKTPAQWYNEEVQAASDNLQRKIKTYQDKVAEIKVLNEAIVEVRRFIEEDLDASL